MKSRFFVVIALSCAFLLGSGCTPIFKSAGGNNVDAGIESGTAGVFSANVNVAPILQSKNGMVTAAHPLAAEVGADILAKGGNAVDAAIAVSLALGVVEPYASGLGGEGYMVASFADGRQIAIDFRSMAPAMATYENFANTGETKLKKIKYSAKGYCVAGVPKGIGEALKYAKLPLKELVAPAVKLAEDGFIVNQTFSKINFDAWEKLSNNSPDFLNDGMPWEEGDTFKNPALASTLRLIGEKGVDVFYNGELADNVDSYMQENGGWTRKSDLQNYKAYVTPPIIGKYRGYEIVTAGGPVGGSRILATLNILENFNLAARSWDDPFAIHLMEEAMVLTALDSRRWIGDPFTNAHIPEKGYISKQYATQRMMRINLGKASNPEEWKKNFIGNPAAYDDGKSYVEVMLTADTAKKAALDNESQEVPPSTTHFSVVDKDGNAVSWTQTISSFFGTSCMVDGYFLNNELGNFKSKPVEGSPINLLPGRRPRTTISPVIVKDKGDVRWVVGSPGGGRIGSTVVEILVNLIDFKMDLEEAVRKPKFSGYDLYKGIRLEDNYPAATISFLEMMGHKVKKYGYPDLYFGGPNTIAIKDDDTMVGVGSIRRLGGAAAPK